MTTDAPMRSGVALDWLDAFLQRYVAAWNSHDADQLLGLMTEDIIYDDAAWPTQMHGHADVRAFLQSAWRAFPDLGLALVEGPYVMADKPKAAFHWRGTGTFVGPLEPPGFAPTGRRVDFQGVDFHEYRDGMLSRLRVDFDVMELSRQLALMPPRGSRIEQGMAATQRAAMRLRRR